MAEEKLKSIVLGLPGSAERFRDYLREEGEDVEFLDCTKLMQFRPYVVYKSTHLSNFLENTPGIRAVYCLIRDNGLRDTFLAWARELGYATPTFVHQTAEVDPTVKLDPNAGIYIWEKAEVMSKVEIGEFTIITEKVCIAQGVKIERGVFISMGTKLGEDCTVRTHAHVVDNVPAGVTVAGIPAKILEYEDRNK